VEGLMAAPILTTEPRKVMAGTTVQWTRVDAGFSPDDGWVETFIAVSASGKITIIASDNGNGSHLFVAAKAVSAAWSVGEYKWKIFAANATETVAVANGDWTVEPDFLALSGALDVRTDWETVLDDLMAAYKEFVASNGARTSYSIAGRATTFTTAEEFVKAIHNARVQVQTERATDRKAQGLPTGTSLRTRLQ